MSLLEMLNENGMPSLTQKTFVEGMTLSLKSIFNRYNVKNDTILEIAGLNPRDHLFIDERVMVAFKKNIVSHLDEDGVPVINPIIMNDLFCRGGTMTGGSFAIKDDDPSITNGGVNLSGVCHKKFKFFDCEKGFKQQALFTVLVCDRLKPERKNSAEKYWRWLFTESPMKYSYLVDDPEKVIQRGWVMTNPTADRDYATFSAAALRLPKEFPERVKMWVELNEKAGIPPEYCHIISSVLDGIGGINMIFDHHSFPSGVSKKEVMAFLAVKSLQDSGEISLKHYTTDSLCNAINPGIVRSSNRTSSRYTLSNCMLNKMYEQEFSGNVSWVVGNFYPEVVGFINSWVKENKKSKGKKFINSYSTLGINHNSSCVIFIDGFSGRSMDYISVNNTRRNKKSAEDNIKKAMELIRKKYEEKKTVKKDDNEYAFVLALYEYLKDTLSPKFKFKKEAA